MLVCFATLLDLGNVHGSVALPTINTNNIVVVTNAAYGAVGDGVFTNTTAIQNAINAATLGGVTNELSGGTVEIPSGTYMCGPLTLKNSVNLQIDSGATLKMLPYGSYPGGTSPTDFIGASKLHDIEISGNGTIDGQGAVWWATNNATSGGINRPKAMFAPTGCNPVLIRDVTLQNPPNTHISFRSTSGIPCGNVTVTNITINTSDGTPNTDGMDMSATNVLVVNSRISDGDDHIAMGDSSVFNKDIVITNCFFGTGHGVSIGSFTGGGLSNLLVVNCTFSGGNGIKVKSERGRGGLVQHLTYLNLSMTNVTWPVLFYSYYNYGEGTLESATPALAASDPAQIVNSTTPIYRNIVVSNVTATASGTYPPIMIWGLPEMLISNVALRALNISASSGAKICQIYNAKGIQLIDCKVTMPAGITTFESYNAQLTFTNSVPAASLITLDGLTTNGIGNSFAFYNAQSSLKNTNALDDGPLTLGGSTFTVSNNLTLFPSSVFSYALGQNTTTVGVKGNLALGGTNNIFAGAGFTNGTYTLMTYTGVLSGNFPTLGATPMGFVCTFNTNTAGQVNLIVIPPPPGIPANLTAQGTNLLINLQWSASSNADSYNLKRSTINGGSYTIIVNLAATNYSDAEVNPSMTYYYVVSATNAAAESANSIQASAIPLPSLVSTNLNFQVNGDQLHLSWPTDHLGWRLQIQTNDLNTGLGTNWVDWPDSTNIFQKNIFIDSANGSVFLRLVYP